MKNVSGIRRTVLAGLVALSGMSGLTAGLAAQTHEPIEPEFQPHSYEPMMMDTPITVDGDTFQIEDVNYQIYTEGENEQIYFTGQVAVDEGTAPAILEVSFFDDEDTPDETIELWISTLADGMDTLEIVDSGLDGDVIWYYVVAESDGLGQVYYVQIQQDVEENIDVLHSILTVDGAMIDVLVTSREEITIGDNAFMHDVDPEEMQQLLDGQPFREGDDD